MRIEITSGRSSDYKGFDLVMTVKLPVPSVMLADQGYDAEKFVKRVEVWCELTQGPMRGSRKMRVGVDHAIYALRNLVERCFNKPKNARRVTTRYDNTAESFLEFVDITSIRICIYHLST